MLQLLGARRESLRKGLPGSRLTVRSNPSLREAKPRELLSLCIWEVQVERDYISRRPLRNLARRRRIEAACVLRLPACSGRGGTTFPRRQRKGREGAGRGTAPAPPPCSRGEVNKPRAGCLQRRGGGGAAGRRGARGTAAGLARPPPHMSRGGAGL